MIALAFLFRHKPYGDVRKQKEENQQDFGKRHARIVNRIKSLPWNHKPLQMETVYPAIKESKAYEPDQHQQNSSNEASDEYTRENFKSFP
jgi:hypothetical protein